MIVKRFVL